MKELNLNSNPEEIYNLYINNYTIIVHNQDNISIEMFERYSKPDYYVDITNISDAKRLYIYTDITEAQEAVELSKSLLDVFDQDFSQLNYKDKCISIRDTLKTFMDSFINENYNDCDYKLLVKSSIREGYIYNIINNQDIETVELFDYDNMIKEVSQTRTSLNEYLYKIATSTKDIQE